MDMTTHLSKLSPLIQLIPSSEDQEISWSFPILINFICTINLYSKFNPLIPFSLRYNRVGSQFALMTVYFLGTWTDKQSSIPYHDVFDAGLDFVGFHSLRSDMSAIGCDDGIREEGLRDDYLQLKFYAVLRA
ncbi:hypothetical protein TNCV_4240211 [Trichonephila clavipes]|nr:hypothetical protein TNCV_4240211 [Trichonephila clavipes]